ncbi:MAG: hypothetical protein AB1424_07355 [Thermodesulfobacteriota bacterium]
MNEKLELALAVLEAMGRKYIQEFLIKEGWEPDRLRSDWYFSFKFLLSKLYMQGRNDSLSDRYLKKMQECLDSYFLPDYTAKIDALMKDHHIPLDVDWNNFEIDNSPLWQQFNETMGKTRDRQMVLDVLRYISKIPDYNIVNHSIKEIEDGRIREHREDLKHIWGVGPKTSAFYLRDVIFLFNCEIQPEEAIELQPIDTWVRQVVESLRDDQNSEALLSTEDWLIQHSGGPKKAALLNAGMWYLGRDSFNLIIRLLIEGNISPEMIEYT